MTYYSKDQVRQIIDGRPSGAPAEAIVQELVRQGHTLEGLNENRGMLDAVPLQSVDTAGEGIAGFGKNVLKSGGRLLRDVAKIGLGAATNTLETLTPLNEETFTLPGEQEASDLGKAVVTQPLGTAKAVGKFYVDRYKDENFGKTLYEDPVGAFLDVSGALGAASKVAKVAGATKTAGIISNVNPAVAGGQAIGAAAKGTAQSAGAKLQTAAQRMYQSALKPSKAVLDKFPDVVQTGLDEGIAVTAKAMSRVEDAIDNINTDIGAQISHSAKGGTVVFTEKVLDKLDETRAFFRESIGGSKYADEIDELADLFRAEQGAAIPIDKAQKLKVNTYQILRKAYGELKTADTEGKKAIARGLKEEIAAAIPELKRLNARESGLIGLEKALERFVGRYGNRELIDLTSGIGGAVGMATEGITGGAKGFLLTKLAKQAIDNPMIKSNIAIIFNKLGKKLKGTNITSPEAFPANAQFINVKMDDATQAFAPGPDDLASFGGAARNGLADAQVGEAIIKAGKELGLPAKEIMDHATLFSVNGLKSLPKSLLDKLDLSPELRAAYGI